MNFPWNQNFDLTQVNKPSAEASISATTINRSNNFNLLRLLFTALVLLSHSPELVDGNRQREILTNFFGTVSFGELAVDGFFLLSGFLIVQSWQRNPNLSVFIKKRVLRIYPAFIAASLISAFIVGPLGSDPSQYISQFDWLRFFKGIFFLSVPAVPPVFHGQPYPSVNASMWTIAYEFRCYLLVALLGYIGIVRQLDSPKFLLRN